MKVLIELFRKPFVKCRQVCFHCYYSITIIIRITVILKRNFINVISVINNIIFNNTRVITIISILSGIVALSGTRAFARMLYIFLYIPYRVISLYHYVIIVVIIIADIVDCRILSRSIV